MNHRQLMREFDDQTSQFVKAVKATSLPVATEKLRDFLKQRKKTTVVDAQREQRFRGVK